MRDVLGDMRSISDGRVAAVLALLLFASGCTQTLRGAPAVALVTDGRADAVIVIPSELPPPPEKKKHPLFIEFGLMQSHARQSAQILADYIRKSTGAELQILQEHYMLPDASAIHVGPTKLARSRIEDVVGLDPDGFLITVPDAETVILVGGSPQGTEFAVYDFLERELGVRWLFAGDLGEHVPKRTNLRVTGPDRLSEPRFISRLFRVKGDGGAQWTRRNRAHSRIEFHHNISKFVPIAWTRSNPEFFPLIDGERYLPKRMNQHDWHPCYSADGFADASADLLIKHLDAHPEYRSVSLGVSDGGDRAYCKCEPCVAARTDRVNSLGYRDYADEYYRWCNAVARRVTEAHPGTLFGCLAYREVGDPPSFDLHPSVVPYLTWELLQWADPPRSMAWRRQTEKWAKRAERLGHYEYMFGEQYMHVPRLYTHALADFCRYASKRGVVGFYAETTGTHADSMWYAGPQPYILLRLLWDPDADVDALMRDWCVSAVGAVAAPHLEAYYRHWERIWTEQVPRTAWFGTNSRTYLKFNSDEYLAAVSAVDLDRAESLLRQTAESTTDGLLRQRADLFLAEFKRRRAERLDHQVAVWDLQRRLDAGAPSELLFDERFNFGLEGWTPFSTNDTDPAVYDAKVDALRLKGDSSIAAPAVVVQPNVGYAVSWRIKADMNANAGTISFIMQATPKVQGQPTFVVQRHLVASELSEGWNTQRFAFRAPGDVSTTFELRCAVLIRGWRTRGIQIVDLTMSQIVND